MDDKIVPLFPAKETKASEQNKLPNTPLELHVPGHPNAIVVKSDQFYCAVLGTQADFEQWRGHAIKLAHKRGDYIEEALDDPSRISIGGKVWLQVSEPQQMLPYAIQGWIEARSDIPPEEQDLLKNTTMALLKCYRPDKFAD